MTCFRPRADPPRVRLLICPYAGGGAAETRRWPAPDDIEVLSAELPGREHRLSERPVRRMAPLIRMLLADIPTDVPYALYGHSMGAWVAFELTRALAAAGRPLPRVLGVGARQAPHVLERDPPLGRLPEAEFLDKIQSRYGAIPDAIRAAPDLLATFLPALRADVVLIDDHTHVDGPALDVPIHTFFAADDPTVARTGVERWAELTTDFHLHEVAGGHFFHRTEHPQILQRLL